MGQTPRKNRGPSAISLTMTSLLALVCASALAAAEPNKPPPPTPEKSAGTTNSASQARNEFQLQVVRRAITGIMQGEVYRNQYGAESHSYALLAKPFGYVKPITSVIDSAFAIPVPLSAYPWKKAAELGWGLGKTAGSLIGESIGIEIDQNGAFRLRTTFPPKKAITMGIAETFSAGLKYGDKTPPELPTGPLGRFSAGIDAASGTVKIYDRLVDHDYIGALGDGAKVLGNGLVASRKEFGKTIDTVGRLISAGQEIAEARSNMKEISKLLQEPWAQSKAVTEALARFRAQDQALSDRQMRDGVAERASRAIVPSEQSSQGTHRPSATPGPSTTITVSKNDSGLIVEGITNSNLPTKIVVLNPPKPTEIGLQNPLSTPPKIPIPGHQGPTFAGVTDPTSLTPLGGVASGAEFDPSKHLTPEGRAALERNQAIVRNETLHPQSPLQPPAASPGKGASVGGITVRYDQAYQQVEDLDKDLEQRLKDAVKPEIKKP